MTIAACYISAEGVVLGADSTSTFMVDRGSNKSAHYFNHAQKVFEVGEASSLGILTWGLAGLDFGELSHRTMIARFADELEHSPSASVGAVATRWADMFWSTYSRLLQHEIIRVSQILMRLREIQDDLGRLQADQEQARQDLFKEAFPLVEELEALSELSVGFCIGGYCGTDRDPAAYEMEFSPRGRTGPMIVERNRPKFWALRNLIERVIFGLDPNLFEEILSSGRWSGSRQDLENLVGKYAVEPPGPLPLRDAIDYVHASIYTTIKSMKFSKQEQFCGGPIEIAVVSTDRKFRWVTHKTLGQAIDG